MPAETVQERVLDRPGLNTPAEDGAWDALRERVTIFLRPIGGPISIGMFGLAAATFVLSGLQLGWIAKSEGKNVALVLIGFSFVAQLVAAIFSFLSRDGVAGTGLGVLALTWLSVGLVLHGSKPGSTSGALGLFLIVAGSALLLSGMTAMLSKMVIAAVFLTASVRLVLAGVYELSGGGSWEKATGYVGLVLLALALYAAWAAELEEAAGKTVLPLGRHGKGRVAVQGSLLEQVKDAPTKPGVRAQL
jgi:succinate-acetate transporter protein